MRPFNGYPRVLPGVVTAAALAALLSGCNLTSSSNDNDNGDEGDAALTVETASGAVQGIDEGVQLAFRGVPYAAPPVGELRFAAPEPAASWDGALVADDYAPACMQPAGVFGAENTDEDCLYLNVYTPDSDGDGRPVMVWIHGGALETGSADASYEPPRLVENDVVVVTINYRLGLLGFMAHPELSEEADGDSGNYGIMDQIAALAWVQENIEAFGGDPDNVTIFGESAGGHSVMSLLVSPQTEGMVDRAIIQSGSYNGDQVALPVLEGAGELTAGGLGCTDDVADCLRGLDAEAFIALQDDQDLSFSPATATSVLPQSINAVLDEGSYPDVDILAGTNLEEGTLFTAIDFLGGAEPTAVEDYADAVLALMDGDQDLADQVVNQYPLENYASPDHALSAIASSRMFVCPALDDAETFAGHGTNVYGYEFADRDAPPLFTVPGFDMGASHAFEIQYLFNTEASLRDDRGMTDEQIDLANAMVTYWASFAHNGDPNPSTGDLPFWPNFSTANNGDDMLELNTPEPTGLASSEFSEYHSCAFWAAQDDAPAPSL